MYYDVAFIYSVEITMLFVFCTMYRYVCKVLLVSPNDRTM